MDFTEFLSLPLNVLIVVAKMCYDDGFDYSDPYGDMDKSFDILKNSSAWVFNDTFNSLDVEFIAKVINNNLDIFQNTPLKNFKSQEMVSMITIPISKTYKVYYERWGNAIVTEKYNEIWRSFDENWVRESMQYEEREGTWNFYDGNYEGNEIEEFEVQGESIVKVVDDGPKLESLLSRLVLENTSEVIDKVDRQTLIKIRNLINQRLSS